MAGSTGAVRDQVAGRERGQRTWRVRPPAGRARSAPRGPRLRWRRVLLYGLLAAVALGAFCVWALYGSPWLRVEKATVSGTRELTPHEVLEAAAVPVGAPLVTVDASAVGARLRKELPRVGSVEVDRTWPHTVALRVTEREPAVLLREGARYVEVDAEGVRFATVDTPPRGVPVVQMRAAGSPSLDRFGPGRLRESAVRVAGALPRDVRRDTRTILVRSYDSITLELTRGRTVLWGSAERSAAKAKALTAVLGAGEGARYFDVSVPSAPAAAAS